MYSFRALMSRHAPTLPSDSMYFSETTQADVSNRSTNLTSFRLSIARSKLVGKPSKESQFRRD